MNKVYPSELKFWREKQIPGTENYEGFKRHWELIAVVSRVV